MIFKFILKITVLVLSGLMVPIFLKAQEPGPEEHYALIREMAFNGDREMARTEARRLVNSYPDYGDARILLARITAWQKKYTEATSILDTLLMEDPSNTDALALKSDIEKWSADLSEPRTNVAAGYSFDRFSEPYPLFWQVYKAGINHKFKWGPGAAYINTGLISAGDPAIHRAELQAEAEAYPKISSKNYAFISYALSRGNHFPSHRAALEVWQILPAGWSASAGINYFRFDRNIFIASVSGEKYAGKFWFSFKTFLFFKDAGVTTSEYINARRYFNDTDYLQLTAGLGTAPDEPFDIQSDIYRLSASSIRLTYFRKFENSMTIRIGAGFSREEYAESILRNRFEGNLMITYPLGNE